MTSPDLKDVARVEAHEWLIEYSPWPLCELPKETLDSLSALILSLLQRETAKARLEGQIEQLQGCRALANISHTLEEYKPKLSSDIKLLKRQLASLAEAGK